MRLPINHFDLLARHYDRLFRRPTDDPLVRLVAAHDGTSILDVGGGTGRTARMFRNAGAWVVVCDSSLQMLRHAAERDLPVVCADVTHLPFADEAFDRALVVDAFHHFAYPTPELAQALAPIELLRILERDGRLIIEEPDVGRWQARLVAVAEWALFMGSRFLATEALVDRVERVGGRCVHLEVLGFSVAMVFRKMAPGDQQP
jgi:ubiquinone/menaquinone biosynthesis C-methylase UbiE